MKRYRVYDGRSPEASIRWLTEAQAAELRRAGYYVTVID